MNEKALKKINIVLVAFVLYRDIVVAMVFVLFMLGVRDFFYLIWILEFFLYPMEVLDINGIGYVSALICMVLCLENSIFKNKLIKKGVSIVYFNHVKPFVIYSVITTVIYWFFFMFFVHL